MADASWEESQNKNPRFRWLIWLLIVLSVAVAVGIIYYNNRDYITGFSAPGGSNAAPEVFSPGGKSGVGGEGALAPGNSRSESGRNGSALSRDSVMIADIACRVMDRADLLVRLSITLFFSDTERKSEILARREVMAVMVQKTLKTMALDDVKTERIKPLLLREAGTVFENRVFNDISINSIVVEKVPGE